ncbi:AAA family ATPase [Paracoccaceae bacterium]|nr:AAA family ATPase [Paracoccaceae bacterium]
MIAVISYFDSNPEPLNCESVVAENTATFRDGFYFVPLNKDDVPLGTQIILKKEPIEGLKKYLSNKNFQGIGPKNADTIAQNIGMTVIKYLHERNVKILEEKTSKKLSEALLGGWDLDYENSGFEILFSQIGFSYTQKKFVKEEFGNKFFAEIHKDPYMLLQRIPRLSFDKIESIISIFGIEVSLDQKIVAATRHALMQSEAERGNTCGPLERVLLRTQEITKNDIETIQTAIKSHEHLFNNFKVQDKNFLETIEACERDNDIAQQICLIKDNFKPIKGKQFSANKNATNPLSEEQVQAIQNSLEAGVSIITGGPGTGKTRIIEGLAQVLVNGFRKTIRICAPTGRAAKRIAENQALKKFQPSTIHMLKAMIDSSAKDIEFDTLIVDESSMIDINLFNDLVKMLPLGSQLILIGDVDQLPPVGAGQPFLDLIRSKKIVVSRLSKQFRQGSDSVIPKVARAINKGELIEFSSDFSSSGFSFVEVDKGQVVEKIIEVVDFFTGNKNGSIDFDKTQILSPMRRYSSGLINLNSIMQKKYNPNGEKVFSKMEGEKEIQFCAGDKVICTQNDYDIDVRNGDIGYVVNKVGKNIRVEFDGEMKLFHNNKIDYLDLAYAITVHKSQGSEYPNVVMPIVDDHRIMLTRKLIYTAITRGKQNVCLIGSKRVLREALKKVFLNLRYSNLNQKIEKANINLFHQN